MFRGPKLGDYVGANFRPLGSREVVGNVLLYFAFHCATAKELRNFSQLHKFAMCFTAKRLIIVDLE